MHLLVTLLLVVIAGTAVICTLGYFVSWLDINAGRRALRAIRRDYGAGSAYLAKVQARADAAHAARLNDYITAINNSNIPVDPNAE